MAGGAGSSRLTSPDSIYITYITLGLQPYPQKGVSLGKSIPAMFSGGSWSPRQNLVDKGYQVLRIPIPSWGLFIPSW